MDALDRCLAEGDRACADLERTWDELRRLDGLLTPGLPLHLLNEVEVEISRSTKNGGLSGCPVGR